MGLLDHWMLPVCGTGFKRKFSVKPNMMLSWTAFVLLAVVRPVFCEVSGTITVEYYVQEEQPLGTVVATVKPDGAPPPYITFSDGIGSAVENVLSLSEDGLITVTGRLDREQHSLFKLLAISKFSSKHISIIIHVTDINDNSPTFPHSVITENLLESTPKNAKYPLGSILDPDLGINSTQRYEIAEGNVNGAFRLKTMHVPNRNGILYLDLIINQKLDYETIPLYNLLIKAYDGGTPPNVGSMRVVVNVIDANDNQPIFNISRYYARVAENATTGSTVLQVFATDRDSGENGRIRYHIDRDRSDPLENFEINPLSGSITVNKKLDYEEKRAYELIVVARDNGTQKLQTTAVVSVQILDINDNKPVIDLKFLTNNGKGHITENAQPGDFVARISVSDPDVKHGVVGVNVTLSGGDGHFGLTTRNSIVYLVILSKSLDREHRPAYTLTVTAVDSGTPPLTARKTFTIYVTDTNDNAPMFAQSVYYADIQEIVPPGSSVIQLVAIDGDYGNNSVIRYTILAELSSHAEWFQIDNHTGLITTKARVDCETASEPRLIVKATDTGMPPMSANATVIVRIRDVNDNQPVFHQSFYNVSVFENATVGSCIMKVTAYDPDCGANAQVHYSIPTKDGFHYPTGLQVDSDSGEICITEPLDYETRRTYDFPVVATDKDALHTTAMVKVTVRDINDNHPQFYPTAYQVSIHRDAAVASTIVVVKATDKDSRAAGRISYSIVMGNTGGVFGLDSTTGVIVLKKGLSSSPSVYTLIVSAIDGGGLVSLSNATVTISVLTVGQNVPQFTQLLYRFEVSENTRTGTPVGTVGVTRESAGGAEVSYFITSGDPHSYMAVDSKTGQIRTAKTLDHETDPTLLLSVQAKSGSPPSFLTAQVNISVTDFNDNAPQFSVSQMDIPVSEDTPLSSTIYVVDAHDADSGDNGRVRYSLANSTNLFVIDSQSGCIKLRRKLDYEQRTQHKFVVIATDSGRPTKKSTMDVTINVQDVNDNAPVFSKTAYEFRVSESVRPNTKFAQPRADDADSGNNARVTYLIHNGANLNIFGIFPSDGYLYTKTALDHEVQDYYDLRIVAIDNGIPAMSTTVPVTIRILDVNDNGPAFDKASYTFHVTENRPPHSVVGFVTASDSDTSDTLHYQLIDKRESFIVSETSGEIITRVALNRESRETYRLTVHVSDQGEPPNTATVEVEVTVDDVNDNNPVFDRAGHYRVEVKENQPEGTLVTQVSARDGDKGENGTISYYFSQADDNHDSKMFSIDSVTGRIITREVLDHEMKSQYMLRVIARDGGSPARETEKLIEVTVDDINETPPRFETSHVAFSVRENTNPGTTVGQVKATDSDSGENGRVLYYIVRGNPLGSFGVDMKTGVVFVAKPVDYEEWSAYSMQIQAIDSSVVNPLSSIIEVNITVIDEDDNLPVFSEDPVVVSIRENIPVGVDIYDISATDADSGKWGEIRYSIESQSPDRGHLRINRRTGTLTIAKVIDYEETRKVSLVVRASNPSKESEFSTGTVVMLIEDVNDNAPEFKMRMRADIMEDEAVGYPIMHVIAVDADSHDNAKLTYLIVSGNEMENFKLNSETGLLSIAKTLDRETTEVFRLNISAADRGQPQHTTYAALAVHVIDVNDNPPVFERSVYVVNVSEGLTLGSVITTVHAVDKDTGVNAELNYLIPVGDDHFTIDLKSGEIRTNTVLDREQQDSWVITAYVKDGAFPALYDTATVMLNVLDENDNAPVFKNHFYHLSVPENANMAVIHTIMASDADTGSYGHVTFSIVGGSKHSLFAIDRETGRLSCKPLDREEAAFHNLTIEARDGGTPPLVATAMIFIGVIDDNDNDPEFTQRAYATSILENVRVGQSVLTVEASDLDLGDNARITYSIHNPTNGKFKINNVTGVIMTAGEFDREKKSSYSFEVSATDGGLYGPRSDQVRVDITILDVNDNAPVFEKIPYTVDIAQNHAIGQYVTQVQADDKDDGDNGKVLYTFEKRNQYFSIDADSGFIKVKSLLDATAVMMHRIRVIARDHGVAPRSSTGVVEVIVGNAPGVGTLRFTNLTYNVYLMENAKAGTPVVQVEAKFASGGPGPIAYSFASGNEDLTFNIHSDRGYVSVSDPAKLDYENHHRLRLIVVATANNAYGYTTVWVNLRDANDNAPHFTQDRYTSSVWEGNSRGTYVTQVIATDVDEGRNARIMYTIISGNTHNAFVIDPPNTGIVKTNVILDREIVDSYRLEVEAVDQGATPLTSTCILRIQIIDDNDNAPFFPSYQDVKVREGTELGTIVKQVTANDVDLNPILTYDFATNGNPEDAFSIDRYSGKIAIAKPLDYERMPRYQLRIQASDKKHTATMRMVIKILDENDNSPEFSQQSYQVTLAEMTGPHYSVVTLNATDRDAGENARVTYTMLLVDGFYINSQTGTIYTNKTVAFNPSQPTIHLVVTAKDHGNPSLSAVIAVRVQVIDINNHAPVFIQAIYSGSVRENNTRGSTILTVSATDADDSYENKKIDYSIASGNHEHVFEISPNTGELILTGELDRERTSSYSMVVRATDRGDRPLNSTAVVNIEVEDVNDNSPVFNLREYHVKVNESITTATRIIQLLAADKDTGENGRVQYTIASGNDDGSFDINIDTGYISVGLPLDHETRDIHRLIIRAIDSSVDSPRQSAFTTVIVNVTDVNEYPPRFPVMMYLESVLENESVGLYVFTAHANDQDGGIYGVVQYELINEKGLFVINRETGDVTTAAQFDYESINSYQFKVNATDRGGRFTTIPVMVNIEAKDEFKPHFVKTKYSFSVPGNAKKGHYVGKVHAGDKDDDYSAKIRYHFREPSKYFEVNQTDGIIFVKKDLQDTDGNEPSSRRRRDVYSRQRRALEKDVVSLNIVASSGSPNAREDEAEIKMEVDRTCPGCALDQPVTQSERGNLTLSGTPLVLLIVFAIIAIILIMVIVVMYIRGRDRKRRLAESIATGCDSSFEALPPPPMRHLAPPAYNETQNYHHNVTTSDVSDQSHSASSGRGSAEYDEDEEIRMINATPMQIQSRVPDSGIQPDDDAASDHSAQNHQQYLANLGIDSSRIPGKPAPDSMTATSVESMHQFSDEGGGEGDGLEAKNLMYPKGSQPAPVPKHVAIKTAHDFGGYIGGTEPSNAGSLSSIINSEEEFSGSYNWDYLLDWGPQYQPLAHVFSEIARLKDDSIKPKKQPTKIIMQQGPKSSLVNTAALQSRARPPPIITDAPPHPSSLPQPIKNPSQLSMHSNSSNSNSVNSARTSQLTSLSGLPKSPISYESTFTSPAMSPSFTPSLSPLARRSPSISPLVTPRGIGSSGQSSGQTTPHRTGGPNTRHHRGLGGGGSSGSEQEIRI